MALLANSLRRRCAKLPLTAPAKVVPRMVQARLGAAGRARPLRLGFLAMYAQLHPRQPAASMARLIRPICPYRSNGVVQLELAAAVVAAHLSALLMLVEACVQPRNLQRSLQRHYSRP